MREIRQGRALYALLMAAIITCLALARDVHAIVVSEGARSVTLKDGTVVHLLMDVPKEDLTIARLQQRSTQQGGHRYYYLPTNLRLSPRPDGTPEFLFLKFTTDKREAEGGVNGALMHFLMIYGLTPAQDSELKAELTKTHDELLGAMHMKSDADAPNFAITSATLKDESLTKSLVTSGKAPLLEGEKIAVASRLTGNGAQLMAATLEKSRSIADVSLTMVLDYTTVTPAIEGTATYHGTKLRMEGETLKRDYTHDHQETCCWFWGSSSDSYSYKEVQNQWKFLLDQNIVSINFVETGVTDERVNKIRDAIFQSFVEAFFKPEKASPDVMGSGGGGDDKKPNNGPDVQGNDFHSEIYRLKTESAFTDKLWRLSYSLPVTERVTLTGNLASWYNGVRDNPKCVAAVNLADPFFTQRDINFILDLDAKEMFDEAINYVTVNVRKERTDGRPFEDHKVIDANYVKTKGIAAQVTYARGEDSNPETYKYQTQWSLKGGNVFSDPTWRTGDWAGVTLSPPVRPFTIELEGDLDALKAKDITRVTAEIHTSQFGREHIDEVQLPVGGAQALVTKKLFRDRDMEQFKYRLIFFHKSAGRLASEWSKELNDPYIYAVIPEDILTVEGYKQRAKGIADGVVEKVLDKLGGKSGGTR